MELFGAVGNLFISLFEILFKNPAFLQEYYIPIEELESGGSEGKILLPIQLLHQDPSFFCHLSFVSNIHPVYLISFLCIQYPLYLISFLCI